MKLEDRFRVDLGIATSAGDPGEGLLEKWTLEDVQQEDDDLVKVSQIDLDEEVSWLESIYV